MGRFLMLMMLMILGTLAQPSPYMTHGMYNGVTWRDSSYVEKAMFVDGAMGAYIREFFAVVVSQPGQCAESVKAAAPSWINLGPNKADGAAAVDFVRGMDTLYQDEANIAIPMINAFQYSGMKLGGATKQELDEYLNIERKSWRLNITR